MCTSKRTSQFQPKGEWIRKEKRLAIYIRDSFRCLYCERDLQDADVATITLEHATARSQGGSNSEHNLFTACKSCNCSRQDKDLELFASQAALNRVFKQTLIPIGKLKDFAKRFLYSQEPWDNLEQYVS